MRPTVLTSLVFAFLAFCLASAVRAERLVSIAVEVDGKPALEGHASDDGFDSPYLVWRHLKGAALAPSPRFQVTPSADDSERATLEGEIVVDVRYGAKVKTTELPLVLVAGNWQVDPVWVEANGPTGNLAAEQAKSNSLRGRVIVRDLTYPIIIGGGLLLIALIAILIVVLGWSTRKSNEAAH